MTLTAPHRAPDARAPALRGRVGPSAALATLCVVLFLTFLDNTVVSVALADIQGSLSANVTSLQWVVNGYALTFAACMLAGGTLGDILGRKRVMLVGVTVFCGGSVLCALAPTVQLLIVGRVLMGLGAAASEPGTLSIIRHVYPERGRRADALGVWTATSGLALALGPVVGGVLVGVADWRAIFWFNVALGGAALLLAWAFVPESSDRQGRHVDVPGIALGAASLAALSCAVIQGEVSGYRTGWVVALFVGGVAGLVAFVLVERHVADPVLDVRLFRLPSFAVSTVVVFATYFGTFSLFFFTALYVQIVADASPYQSALDFLPMAATLILASVVGGPWVARRGARGPAVVGCLLGGIGILATSAVIRPTVGFFPLSVTMAVAGVGFGLALVAATTTSLSVVPPERSGMAASTTNTSRELGAVFGVAVLGAIVNAQLTGQLAARLKAIGIPPSFQSLVMHAVTGGGLGSGGQATGAEHDKNASIAAIATKVVNAAYDAFGTGLHIALALSGALLVAVAVLAAVAGRRHRSPSSPATRSWPSADTSASTTISSPTAPFAGNPPPSTSGRGPSITGHRCSWRPS